MECCNPIAEAVQQEWKLKRLKTFKVQIYLYYLSQHIDIGIKYSFSQSEKIILMEPSQN